MVGIKGTGMTALAEILVARGAVLSGSDGPERFYTDEILQSLGVPYDESFAASHVDRNTELVIHSAAYDPAANSELIEALARGIPVLSYPQALGELSSGFDAVAVAGTHGKTSTTAMIGSILKGLALPATVLAGSQVGGFGDRSALVLGDQYLIAETCEYRRHFLFYHPRRIVLTAVEADHLDYFRDLEDVRSAFVEYCLRLPDGGLLLYHCDEPGARSVAETAGRLRPRLRLLGYGEGAEGPYRITDLRCEPGNVRFRLAGFAAELSVHVPGRHSAYNATAAVALVLELLAGAGTAVDLQVQEKVRRSLADFSGSRRRSEVLGTAGGVLFMDDYAHHPTEIARTLEGLREFYPERRLVVDFMSHTYSRTRRLLEDFGRAFGAADLVVLHRIYASAREQDAGLVRGEDLAEEVRRHHSRVEFFSEPSDALGFLQGTLRAGDLFITMGAGDNWRLGRALLHGIEEKTA